MSCDVYFEAGAWDPETYLDFVVEQALEHALEGVAGGYILDPVPESIEPTY